MSVNHIWFTAFKIPSVCTSVRAAEPFNECSTAISCFCVTLFKFTNAQTYAHNSILASKAYICITYVQYC